MKTMKTKRTPAKKESKQQKSSRLTMEIIQKLDSIGNIAPKEYGQVVPEDWYTLRDAEIEYIRYMGLDTEKEVAKAMKAYNGLDYNGGTYDENEQELDQLIARWVTYSVAHHLYGERNPIHPHLKDGIVDYPTIWLQLQAEWRAWNGWHLGDGTEALGKLRINYGQRYSQSTCPLPCQDMVGEELDTEWTDFRQMLITYVCEEGADPQQLLGPAVEHYNDWRTADCLGHLDEPYYYTEEYDLPLDHIIVDLAARALYPYMYTKLALILEG